jgi:hypothetical protein
LYSSAIKGATSTPAHLIFTKLVFTKAHLYRSSSVPNLDEVGKDKVCITYFTFRFDVFFYQIVFLNTSLFQWLILTFVYFGLALVQNLSKIVFLGRLHLRPLYTLIWSP